MERPLLAYTLWLGLSADQKQKLTKLYSIPRTGEVVVHVGEMMAGNIGGSAKQDGHRPEDLYAVTVERSYDLLNEVMPEKPDFYGSFQAVLDNLDAIYQEQHLDEVIQPESLHIPVQAVDPLPPPVEETPFVPRDPEELIKPKVELSEDAEPTEESKPIKNAKAKKSTTK